MCFSVLLNRLHMSVFVCSVYTLFSFPSFSLSLSFVRLFNEDWNPCLAAPHYHRSTSHMLGSFAKCIFSPLYSRHLCVCECACTRVKSITIIVVVVVAVVVCFVCIYTRTMKRNAIVDHQTCDSLIDGRSLGREDWNLGRSDRDMNMPSVRSCAFCCRSSWWAVEWNSSYRRIAVNYFRYSWHSSLFVLTSPSNCTSYCQPSIIICLRTKNSFIFLSVCTWFSICSAIFCSAWSRTHRSIRSSVLSYCRHRRSTPPPKRACPHIAIGITATVVKSMFRHARNIVTSAGNVFWNMIIIARSSVDASAFVTFAITCVFSCGLGWESHELFSFIERIRRNSRSAWSTAIFYISIIRTSSLEHYHGAW